VTTFRCGSKDFPSSARRVYSIGVALPGALGSASCEPIQATCTRPPRPTARCAPRTVPIAIALPGWLFTRTGADQFAPPSAERAYRTSLFEGSPLR